MEQLLTVASSITTIAGALLSIVGLVVMIYIIVLCSKFNRLMKQINMTAESVQQLSMLPLQVINSLLQKFLGPHD